REGRSRFELRIDGELAVRIDVTRASADRHHGEAVRKRSGLFELRRDLDAPAVIHVAPAAIFADQEKTTPLLSGPNRSFAPATRCQTPQYQHSDPAHVQNPPTGETCTFAATVPN